MLIICTRLANYFTIKFFIMSNPFVRIRDIFFARNGLFHLMLCAVCLFVLLIATQRASAQAGQRKIQPRSRSTISLKDLEKREKFNKTDSLRKKLANEADDNLPRNLPIPPGAQIKRFTVPSPDSKNGSGQTKKKGAIDVPGFPALGDNGTIIPPDIGAAAGPNHLMIALNSQVRIQDKAGAILSTVTLNNFFSSLAGITSVFDPKVLYDRVAQRWIITAPANAASANSSLCLGISATSDPTGTWNLYSFDADAANTKWFDYPSIGFNGNWIVVTGNIFTVSSNSFVGAMILMFDKAATYSGTANPTITTVTGMGGTIVPAVSPDNSTGPLNLISNWNGNSGGSGFLRLFTITGTPAAPFFAATAIFPAVTSTWATVASSNFAPQNTVANLIAAGDARIQNAVFRGGSLWCTQTAFVPAASPIHSVIQWWQIDPITGNVQQFGRVDDGAAIFYAFPSIGVNAYKDVLLGYSSFSLTQFASCNTSFRSHTDALNTMQPSIQYKAGVAKYFKTFGGTTNRWGDYSSTFVDPDDFSFWTAQEYAALPTGGSDRWGTEWRKVIPVNADLYIKDRIEDLGLEPNPSTLPMWQSDDIWVRQTRDLSHAFAHMTENGEFRTGASNPNYVYVEVHNRGGAASDGTEQLSLYWAKASSGLGWTSPWTGGTYFDPGHTMLMGAPIGTINLPIVPAGGSTILEFAWNPPDPGIYTGSLAPDKNHFCLLARVATATGMTYTETSNLYANVINNNNIAWKNIAVYDLLPGSLSPAYATIANPGKENMNTKVKFFAQDASGDPILGSKGLLRVFTSGKLQAMLQKNKASGKGIKDKGNGAFDILEDGAFLDNVKLGAKEFSVLKFLFIPDNADQNTEGYAITVVEIDRSGSHERIVGGQTAVFGKVKGFGTGNWTGNAKLAPINQSHE